MKSVIFLLLVCISSIISKTIYTKTNHLCIGFKPVRQHGKRRAAELSNDHNDSYKQGTEPPGYQAISAALGPEVEIAENQNDSKNTPLLNQDDYIDDSDINKESNDNSNTQLDPMDENIESDTEKKESDNHDDSNTNTKKINYTSIVTVNNKVNIAENSTNNKNKGIKDKALDNYTDITNMREVRAHLLDHLLEYFMNIIKQGKQYTQIRKKYTKDKMKLEDKLRNYYNPERLDEFLYNSNSDYDTDIENSNGRRNADEGTDDDIIINNEKNVTPCNKNIEPLKLNETKTDEDPINKNYVTDESILNENQNNKIETVDLHLQHENEQNPTTADDNTSNGELLNIEENTKTLPSIVVIGDNTKTCSTCITKTDTYDILAAEKDLKNNKNNMKSINEINGRRRLFNSDANKYNNLKENSTIDITLHRKPVKKSIMVKILDSLKRKGMQKLAPKRIPENLFNQNTTQSSCPYNFILQLNINI